MPTSFITSSAINVLMLIMLLFLIINNTVMSDLKRKAYLTVIVLTMAVITSEVLASVFDQMGAAFRNPNLTVNVLGFSLSTVIPIVLAIVYDEKLIGKLKYFCIPILLCFVLLLSSPWTGLIFNISSNNEYSRGPIFSVYIMTYLFSLSILIISNYRQSKQYQRAERNFLLLLYSIFFLGTAVQIFFPQIHSSWHCITLTLVMYYLFQRELQFKYDILTDVLNRQAFERHFNKLSDINNTGIILLDLDKFKEINDQFGHTKGDYYLKTAASIINSSFKNLGQCYRIGGDEFCVLTSNVTEQDIIACVKSMQSAIRKEREFDPLLPTISYGYSIFQKNKHADLLHVLQEADERMYCCKKRNLEQEKPC